MKFIHLSKRGVLGVCLGGIVALLVVACGGGGSDDKEAAVQEAERAQALGLLDKLPVSWAPTAITFSANPGARQDVPITLTTKVALKNAKIVFVPDFRNAVTVTPDTIAALGAGQSATVTLTFAPAVTDTRKLLAGIVLLFDKNATTSQPLPVKMTLLKPENINGIAVPPEPPASLNNATLAGFDINGNGIRDDVERTVASRVSSQLQFSNAVDIAAYYQTMIKNGAQSQSQSDAMLLKMACADIRTDASLTSRDIQALTLNTTERSRQFRSNTAALGGIAVDTAQDCK